MRKRILSGCMALGLLVLSAAAGPSSPARACDMNVREAGFIVNSGEPYIARPYELWMVCQKATPEAKAYAQKMEKFIETQMEGTNLLVEVKAVEKLGPEARKELKKMGIDVAKLPLTTIVLERDYEYATMKVTPGQMGKDAVKALIASPKKLEIKKLLSENDNYCMVLFSPGKDPKAGAAALKTVQTAIAEHQKRAPKQKIPVIQLDRSDPKEAFLVKELGLSSQDTESLAVILFGKGRVLLPVMKGKAITKDNFLERYEFLNHNASDCNADPVFVLEETADLLIRWEPELDEKVITAIRKSGILERLYGPWDEDEAALLEPQPASQKGPATTAAAPLAAPGDATPPRLNYTLPALGGVLVLVLIVGWLVMRKKRAGQA